MSTKNMNNYKYKTFHDTFGKLHKEYSHRKADCEASAKWKEVKEKLDILTIPLSPNINSSLSKRKVRQD